MGYLDILWFGLVKIERSVLFVVKMLWLSMLQLNFTLIGVILISIALTTLFFFGLFKVIITMTMRQKVLEADPTYQDSLKVKAEQARQRYLEDAYRYLTCPTATQAPVVVSLAALPKERRTLRLRFYDFKRAVCRPFAG